MNGRSPDAMLLLLLALQPALSAPAPALRGCGPAGSPWSALREPCLPLAACRGGCGEGPDDKYATDEDRIGEAYASSAVVRDPDDDDLLPYASRGASLHEPAGESEEDESSESWTVQEPLIVRKRRQEEENAVKEFGGDLGVLGSGAKGLRAKDWDTSAATNEQLRSQFVSHAAKKALEQEALIAAAGGGLGACFAGARPSVFERDKREWDAAGSGRSDFISAKERKKQEEDALRMSFGGDLSAMSARDKTHLRKQSWEQADSTGGAGIQFVSAAERKRREEEEALKAFGGGLENCVRHEPALEREKREFKLSGKVKRRKKPT